MWEEFKDFAMKGNVVDMAVGVVIGGAFGAIVNSLVDDIIMPLVGMLTGGIDFSGLSLQVGDAVLAYGNFINAIINFGIISFSIFMAIRQVNRIIPEEETVEVETTKTCPFCKTSIDIEASRCPNCTSELE